MNEKTKKILIYGGAGVGIVGVGIYVYIKYYSTPQSTTSAAASPNITPSPATGQAVVMNGYSPEMLSGASLGGGYNLTPEQPVVQVSSGNNTNSLNSFIGQEVNANTATASTLSSPSTPNLILNSTPLINQAKVNTQPILML